MQAKKKPLETLTPEASNRKGVYAVGVHAVIHAKNASRKLLIRLLLLLWLLFHPP